MQFEFKPSFLRLVEKLGPGERKRKVVQATQSLMVALEERTPPAPGLGLKRLRGKFWEVRAGLGDRVILHWEKDVIGFVLVGDHKAVRRFLKTL
ncbi:MAG: hypothetical protein HYT87_19680 [Nitrospirae bacterium]|nr:hypothetical protein [Nitrospirota bacterium]